MKKIVVLLFLLSSLVGSAQRWYAINDSTDYNYEDVSITVGRHKVYRNIDNNLTVVHDFDINNSQIPEDYIRDFDFIDATTWYVLVGSRYIGTETELYKTTDAGVTWTLITPQTFTAPISFDSTANNINQIQFLNGRIYLFDRYYQSRVFYSDDLGQTWTHWFECFWSHYYQIYACGDDLYIHGLEGDGFKAYMVQIPSSYMGQQNIITTNVGNCHNNAPGCYFVAPNTPVPDVFYHFQKLFNNTICALKTPDYTINQVTISPNPVRHFMTLNHIDQEVDFSVVIYNQLGQICLEKNNVSTIDCATLPQGFYFVELHQNGNSKTLQFIKQ